MITGRSFSATDMAYPYKSLLKMTVVSRSVKQTACQDSGFYKSRGKDSLSTKNLVTVNLKTSQEWEKTIPISR
jgi:hypothetical protein